MLARLALARPEDALDLWDQTGGDLFDDGVPSFFFRHLVELARHEAGG